MIKHDTALHILDLVNAFRLSQPRRQDALALCCYRRWFGAVELFRDGLETYTSGTSLDCQESIPECMAWRREGEPMEQMANVLDWRRSKDPTSRCASPIERDKATLLGIPRTSVSLLTSALDRLASLSSPLCLTLELSIPFLAGLMTLSYHCKKMIRKTMGNKVTSNSSTDKSIALTSRSLRMSAPNTMHRQRI